LELFTSLIERHQLGRRWLNDAEIRLIEDGDLKEIYRLVSNHVLCENAVTYDPDVKTPVDLQDEAWGFDLPRRELKREDGTIGGYPHGSSILHVAVYHGQPALIKKLFELKRKPDMDMIDVNGDSALHVTLKMKRSKQELDNCLLALIEGKANVNILDLEKYTPIMRACQVQNWKMADILIYSGKCNINLQPDVTTPLHLAVEFKDLTTIRSILKHGAELKLLDKTGKTALDLAVIMKDKEIIIMLLKHDPNINTASPMAKHYLPLLIELGHFEKVKEILENDPSSANYEWNNPEYDIEKCTLIAAAIQFERLDVAKLLLEHYNANVNSVIVQKVKKPYTQEMITMELTALHLAIIKKSDLMVSLLLQKGADVTLLTEPDKLNPLMLSVKSNVSMMVLKLLLDHPDVDINSLSGLGANLIHFAAEADNVDLIKELIAKGLDVNNETKLGQSVLSSACLAGKINAAKELIDTYKLAITGTGGEKFITDSYPPLHCAVIGGNVDLVAYLLDKAKESGEDLVNFSLHENQMKPIHLATLNGHFGVLKLLLDRGADVQATINISGDKGVNCLHLASGYGYVDMVNLLLDHGIPINAATTVQKQTPVHFALRRFQFNVVQALGERGGASDGMAVQLAIQTGNVEIIEVLEKMKK
jgi:ankyrin repeat protein